MEPGDTIHFLPTEEDLAAIANLFRKHPDLRSISEVLRYALHRVAALEQDDSTEYPWTRLKPGTDATASFGKN